MHFAYGRDVNHRELKGRLAVGLQSGPQCSLTHILFICMCVCVCVCALSHSVASDSLQPHGL